MLKYNIYNKIFSGAVDNNDMNFIKERCSQDDSKIIELIIRSKKLTGYVGYQQMLTIINDLQNFNSKEDCIQYLCEIKDSNKIFKTKNEKENIFTNIQQEIIDRILANKPETYLHVEIPKIKFPCPHCKNINNVPLGTSYIVCGVDAEGLIPIENYENCCFNDWCFGCKKILCKNWYKDELYNEENRSHNEICCRVHAKNNSYNYPNDYCQCLRRGSFMTFK